MSIIEWWNALGLASQIFYCIAIPASLILLVQTVMLFLGLDDDADAADDIDIPDDDLSLEDADADDFDATGGLEGLRIFTVRGIIAFLVVFGWVGVVMDAADATLWLTIPVSALCGFAMMVVLAFLFRAVMRLRNDGNADNRNAVGTIGQVHLLIPATRGGIGKVHVMLQGAYVERDAVTDESEAIPTGTEVVVIGVSGQTHLIVKRK
ncbi:MAG: hypothetical protein E7618_03925 [Ruminococcaceae bacterium]|nr:hypothetical protein [Oscillospiraceae bacterium]